MEPNVTMTSHVGERTDAAVVCIIGLDGGRIQRIACSILRTKRSFENVMCIDTAGKTCCVL